MPLECIQWLQPQYCHILCDYHLQFQARCASHASKTMQLKQLADEVDALWLLMQGFGVSLSTDKHMRDTRGWNVLGMFLLVPIVPLIILLVYQSSIGLVIKHCDIKYSREETSQQLPQSPDECCLLVDSVANQWSLRYAFCLAQ